MGGCTSGAVIVPGYTRLDDATVVITGGNSGVGKETASFLYSRGGRIVLACRDTYGGEMAIKSIQEEHKSTPNTGSLALVRLNLASLTSVRECAKQILDTEPRINILINNAGIVMGPYAVSEDGYELQFATNYLGHFLFTILLLPRMLRTADDVHQPSRILNLSSILHQMCESMEFDDINLTNGYTPLKAYSRSKAANALFTTVLVSKLKKKKVNVYSIHPGVIHMGLYKNAEQNEPSALEWIANNIPINKNAWEGAQTTIYCALSEVAGKETGLYYSDCRIKIPSEYVQDPEVAEKLFTVSLKMVKYAHTEPNPFVPEPEP